MPFVHAAGVDVHYVEHGHGDHTAVLLHGFSPDHRLMTGCFEPVFAKRDGWRRVYLDLPGMGLTKAPADLVGTDAVFAVVRATIDALVPGRYAVAGESYGGYLARGLVAAEPDRVTGMALVCPVIGMERDVDERVVLVSEVEDFSEIAVVLTEETRRRQAEEIDPGMALADPAALDRIRSDYAGTMALEPRPYACPSVLITGRQDNVTGYRDPYRILESYPRATFAVLDRAGHNAHFEQPALFDALVHEWLDRVEEALLHQGREAVGA
ncbi:Pimeloyl-ACP methyl ester carboxylesterase [Actinokineospora alba]|uniref:Pimeloyl-ACP methyl ester carboxylesterase n=1 Tax=Actinokineospora alba TaxID=504798 RepID=A0A1H0VYI7_9PSEU|nr:alpha/beta hydrolase [Actinokineospora alba]TDP67118.1 pimeloyl-ACP methyl ester carboxylesterase [Actinokineospora alba]SDJ46435.1 Pimeloyl-ACP methyl ester carboxylesterase [Actinokineospora alba]SDP83176.1 Pimeloyl-ACP methyl ester carboxylesterase [Actinokineospora alba]